MIIAWPQAKRPNTHTTACCCATHEHLDTSGVTPRPRNFEEARTTGACRRAPPSMQRPPHCAIAGETPYRRQTPLLLRVSRLFLETLASPNDPNRKCCRTSAGAHLGANPTNDDLQQTFSRCCTKLARHLTSDAEAFASQMSLYIRAMRSSEAFGQKSSWSSMID